MDPEIRNAEESTLFKAPVDESTGLWTPVMPRLYGRLGMSNASRGL